MTKHTLSVQARTITGRAVKKLRAQGLVPANIFGKKITSLPVQFVAKEFDLLRRQVGESTLLYLQVAGDKDEHPVLIREIVFHPMTSRILHVSFNQVNLKERVTAPVPVALAGESPAEKEKLGILVQLLNEVEIESLPTDMPEGLQADVSGLTEVGASLTVADLSVDTSRITIKTAPGEILVRIEPLAAEEKVEAPPAPVEGAAPAAPAEGAAPATAPATAAAPAAPSAAPEKK